MSVVNAILSISAKMLVIKTNKGSKMENITVGSQFTTAKSGVSGIVQEVIENKNGSFRVRLDVAGQPRWTTVTK
jgi:glycine betaine/choline ABC-type transport system substrate-binding protein